MSSRGTTLQVGISWILRAGVGLSLVLETAGILLSYQQTGDSSLTVPSAAWLAKGGNFFGFALNSLTSVFSGANPAGIASLGVAVLMLTPYARIIAALVYYLIERDWKYVGITSIVFSVITLGLLFL
ncbi:MAG: DUF1634 domain-containing protein [Thaumarchaeota archaeon]|nr:DUF1634 domain-containing protein [Nitrososphaerota archaeon]